jgi:hypothetical protein
MRSSRWMLMLLLLAAMPFAGCSKGGECTACTNVGDCESGLSCQQFVLDNGDLRNLCGGANTRTCSVPR